jgi:glucosamine--fructose-6-phosphate aminotransferase (isomerizing)
MCGIFGLIANPASGLNQKKSNEIIEKLFLLSESRGKESAGIAVKNTADKKIQVLKHSIPASQLIGSLEYKKFIENSLQSLFDVNNKTCSPFAVIAHARLVTNGSQENNNNNQPVIKAGSVAVHNGIITNVDELWQKYQHLGREFEVDTEVFIAIIKHNIAIGKSIIDAVQLAYQEIKGTASTGILFSEFNKVIVASNNASLYYTFNKEKGMLIFASENYILQTTINDLNLKGEFGLSDAIWSKPFSGKIIDMDSFEIEKFGLTENKCASANKQEEKKDEIVNHSPDKPVDFEAAVKLLEQLKLSPLRNHLEFNLDAINKLKRCSKCLLPETFPYIQYDIQGICNYCHSYIHKFATKDSEAELKEKLKKYVKPNGGINCIVPFSGGRDSSYGLHYIVHELKLKPLTFTYDWGMVTDLARRNIARICGKLGVENILVSADIHSKRRNIKLNVEAWLKKPELGMIPLFMAGDKHFFYYVNVIKKQTNVPLDIWMGNSLEDTNFKVGFAGQSPDFDKERVDSLAFRKKIGLALYYAKNFIQNPAYMNKSLVDTAWAFYSYYAEPRTDFYMLFDYVPWDEKLIEKTLFEEYNWEISPDTTSTWRIGDGTAAFYNYIYYTVAGFSEFDTFRSNQIREGLITREEGLKFIAQENRPRFESMKWYLDTIGVDMERAIKVVNAIPKLYHL